MFLELHLLYNDEKVMFNIDRINSVYQERSTVNVYIGEDVYKVKESYENIVKRINKCYKSIKVDRSNKESPIKLVIREWRAVNPEGSKAQCRRETGISRPTIDKYWNTEMVKKAESEE